MRPVIPSGWLLVDGSFHNGNEDDKEEESKDDRAEDESLRLGSEFLCQIHFPFLKVSQSGAGMEHRDYTYRVKGREVVG